MPGRAETASRCGDVFWSFLRLGLTSFGGPIAHLGYFRSEFVERRRWLSEEAYAETIALCQFLPGPASSQAGMILGMKRAGLPGALAAWVGFTVPSAIALIIFAYGVRSVSAIANAAWLHGFRIVAVSIVAQAVWNMAQSFCPDRARASLAVAAMVLTLALPSAASQIGAIALGGILGWRFIAAPSSTAAGGSLETKIGRVPAAISLLLFFGLLGGLPLAAAATSSHTIELVSRFYRSGALVFGGGHVVLPLLQQAVVPPGWLSNSVFLAGYGAAQAIPGPLFSFAAYLGAAMNRSPNGFAGGMLCLIAIYLPSFLLLIGILPFWQRLRQVSAIQAALRGINAAVVGMLLGALYAPVWINAIFRPGDFCLAVIAFLLLIFWKTPPGLVAVFGAIGATILAYMPPFSN
ncbi:MAG TPA: chromate efflux transporter [Methylocella sp.]|nr:chromate efflux transporter [Methylocella sp.]